MVDEQDGAAPLAPGLTPEQESAVRRLVADARHDEPIPATVAARLDKVLAHLATDSASDTGTPLVVDLDTRRRRRTAGRLLLAAAAVVVGGVAVGQVLGDSGFGPTSGDDAGDTAATAERNQKPAAGDVDAPEDGAFEAAPEAASGDAAEVPGVGGTSADDSYAALRRQVPVALSEASLRADVRRVYRDADLARTTAANKSLVDAAVPFDCPDAAYGDGLLLPALYDGQPTVLAFRPPVGSKRLAELLECGTAVALDQLTLNYNPGN